MTVDKAKRFTIYRGMNKADLFGEALRLAEENDTLAAEVRRLREGCGQELFIVNAHVDYESQYVVAGFADKELAEAYVAKCEEYEKLLDYDCDYGEVKAWKKEHPAGEDASVGAAYVTVKIPFISEAPHG